MKNTPMTPAKTGCGDTPGGFSGIPRPLSIRCALIAVLPLFLLLCAAVVYVAAGTMDGSLEGAVYRAVSSLLQNGQPAAAIKIAVFAALFTLFVCIILYIYFRSIFKRIIHLSGVLDGISKGVYTEPACRLPPDETGALAAAVNNLSNVVQADKLCRMYKLNNLNEHEHPASAFKGGGERAAACLMYIEIDKWTEKPFHVPSKRLIAMLVKYYDIVSDCARKTGGSIESYFDSSVNLLWNGPAARAKLERDIYNCARCALFIRHALSQYNKKQKNPALRIYTHIGIHYGPVTAGLIKINRGEELKVTGSSLVTARTAAACAAQYNFDILISGTAQHFVDDYLITEQLTPENDEETAGGLYALINIKNPQRIKQKHPRTADEVRKIIYI